MQLNLIELDIQHREEALKRCKANLLACIMKTNSTTKTREVELLGCEIFYLKDQLGMLRCIASILKEEQGAYDEMLPKV